MKTITFTFIVCALVVYVYIDYDHIKEMIYGPSEKIVLKQEEVPKEEPPAQPKPVDEKIKTRFEKGEMIYINAMVGDVMIWDQNKVPGWATYEGSPRDQNQRINTWFEHRTEVRVILVAIGKEEKAWYYVRTPSGFPYAGWVEEKYLSKELPSRRSTRTSSYR